MNSTKRLTGKIGFMLGTAFLGALTGCIGYVDRPAQGQGYAQHPSAQGEAGVAVQADYVYYPNYEVYYSGNTRQYVYLEGRSWVSRPAPPRVSVGVLVASPSVRLEFHDSPAAHHATVVRQYPKNWAPPGASRGAREVHDEGRDEGNQKGEQEHN